MRSQQQWSWESMATMYQVMATASYSNARVAMETGNLKLAAFLQRQSARDFKTAWYYLNGAILCKRGVDA